MAMTRTPARRPAPLRADGQVLGAMLVVGGLGWLLQQSGVLELSAATTLSALVITLGIGLVVTARSAGGGGLVALGLALTLVLASISAVDVGALRQGVGERRFRPLTAVATEKQYQLGVGSLTVDLTAVPASDLVGKRIRAQVGVGELIVLLPPASKVPVRVVADAKAGEITLFDQPRVEGGGNLHREYLDQGSPLLELDLDVALGSIVITRPRPA